MSKNILILSGSPRPNGNSALLCNEFQRGAEAAGNNVKTIFVNTQKIATCKACYYCKKSDGLCAIADDMAQALDWMHWADAIVLASPIYFYSVNAQIKAVIDRSVAQWTKIQNKDFYYILTAAETDASAFSCGIECFRGFARCLSGSKEKGILCAGGVYEAGAVKATPYMQQAYDMGKGI